MTRKLTERPVLIVDIQAAGSHPETDSILEIGWTVAKADSDLDTVDIKSHLICQQEDFCIPRRITRITGISSDMLESGEEPVTVWRRLETAARKTARANNRKTCPTIIHYSRYEQQFLEYLHRQFSQDKAFPFDIICSHEIVKRLYPDLPRRGLRAVAGFFGNAVDEERRAEQHVRATLLIWHRLADELESMELNTFRNIEKWIGTTSASARTGRAYLVESAKRLALPDTPGIYRMLRSNGDILYIGKAKSLKRRVNSYFTKKRGHSEHILEMLSQATSFEKTNTETALEAALLENDEIKRIRPPYNKSLRQTDKPLYFATPDLDSISKTPDKDHFKGPFPSPDLPAAIAVLRRLFESDIAGTEDIAVFFDHLRFEEDGRPDNDIFMEGVALFRETHNVSKTVEMRELYRIGRILWELRNEESEDENDTDTPDDSADDCEEVWTVEDVLSLLESCVRRISWLERRGRWLTILLNCSLSWIPVNAPDGQKRLLIISNGVVKERRWIASDHMQASDSTLENEREKRLAAFTFEVYERMRVLSTELKRLSQEKSGLQIRTGRHTIINNLIITKLLQWL